MSGTSTTLMLERFKLEVGVPGYFASMFTTTPKSVHDTEMVEVDILRETEDIAVPVPNINSGYRENQFNKHVNKQFTPAIVKEQIGINGFDLIKRQPGANPFENPDFARTAGEKAFEGIRLLGNKVRRTVELMGSQVMQTGIISIPDAAGVAAYTLDFGMRSAHKVTTTAWAINGSTGTPIPDIDNLAKLIRTNGKRRPNKLTFGNGAIQRFLANTEVQLALDKTKFNLGLLDPALRSEDSTYLGTIWIRNYQYEIWLTDSYYNHPQTGVMTPYMGDNRVIVSTSKAKMTLSWGSIPRIAKPEGQAAQFLPSRLTAMDVGMDMHPFSYISENGESLILNLGGRPLTQPTEIDSYGCLTVF